MKDPKDMSMEEAIRHHHLREYGPMIKEFNVPEKGLLGKGLEWLKEHTIGLLPEVGGEHLKSWLRLGGHEITQALSALPDSNIRPMEEPGVVGNEIMPHIVDNEPAYRGPAKEEDRGLDR